MKILNKVLSLIIIFTMAITSIPINVFADSPEKEYSISNGYLTYTINNKTGGFSIVTDEGHPQKKYDNNIPLLYKEDKTRSNGTSFVTVRIDGKDYIFGQSYGMFGISSQLHEPVVSEEGRLLTVQWDIKGYSVIQKIALSIDEKSDITGNVGISYQIINNNSSSGNVGIRLLLDTALNNNVDSPYVITDTKSNPQYTEKEYKGLELPQQIRLADSLSSPKKMAYLLLKGWNNGVVPDKVIVGHWANIANTKYNYSADSFCDFSNYSNKHRTPDSAIALYWSESTIGAGAVKTAEVLYGISNFSSDTGSDTVGIDIVTNKVSLTADKKNYRNNGEFEVTVNLDNSLSNSQNLTNPMLVLTADSGLTVIGEYHKTWSEIKVGETKTVSFRLRADKQSSITSKMIYVSLSSMVTEGDTQKTVEASSSRHILLPAVTGALPKIQMNSANPSIVYTQGDKSVTVSGKMDEFSSLKGSVNWDMYLMHTSSNHEVLINKRDISFIDDSYTAFSFKTREELSVGAYKIVFRLRDTQLKEGFGTDEITASCLLNVSADEKYKQISYGILALVRYENSNYKYITFASESDYKKFYKGQTRVDGIQHDFSQANSGQNEILLIIRGRIVQMEKEEDGKKKIYYQASSNDGPITINNMLSYESDTALTIQDNGSEFSVSGDGKLNVINSITVWKYKWSFNVSKGKPYTLDTDRYKRFTSGTPEELKLNLDGAGMILQSIAGFLVNIKYGVMNSELQSDDERSTTYGIGFGGSLSIPIKAEDKEKKEDEEEEENDFSKGQLAVDIDEILYGEKAKLENGKLEVEDTGFIGIDANVTIALPEDVLGKFIKNAPGIRAFLTINTIKNEYELDLGVKVKVLECQGILAFKQMVVKNSEKIVPDKIEFYIHKGIKIPIAPPSLFMTAIGGGVNDLAATIGGDTISGLPPLTILAYTRLELINKMIGDFNAAINLQGMNLDGSMTFNGKKGVAELDVQISAGWTEPWYVNVYGNISIIDGLLKGGVTIKIAEDYFYGYIYAKICIPDSVPIIGGKEINGVEAAVTNTYIGANIKIIGIKFGVIYYWDGGYDFGSGIDLSEKSFMRSSSTAIEKEISAGNYEFMYGTNIHPLESKKINTKFRLLGSTEPITINFDPSGKDALLFAISYDGYAIPKPEDITITSSKGNIEMTEDDGKGGGNFLVQDRGYEGKYIYVTVTNADEIVGGNWTLTVNSNSIEVKDFSVSGVDYLPELTETSFIYNNENPFNLNVNWATDKEYNENTVVDVYLTKDENILEKIKTSSNNSDETLGISVAHMELDKFKDGSSEINLPDTLESGEYYVVTTMTSKSCGISLAISSSSFDFVNANLPQPVKSVELKYAGNGSLLVEVEDSEKPDYTDYIVNIVATDDASLDNAFGQFGVGDDIIIGKNSNLMPGQTYIAEIRTLRYDGSKHYYSTNVVRSNAFIMPELNKPRLLSVTTNAGSDYLNTSKLTVTYKFDRAVWMLLDKNSEFIVKNKEYKDTWTFNEDLVDGSYLIDFIAYSSTKDSVQGADFAKSIENAQLGFIVDTQAPILSLGQKNAKSLEPDGTDYITSTFGTNVVFADNNGKYTITGISEANSTLMVNGKKVDIIQADGSFTYTGTCNEKEPYTELLIEAIDKAENKASMLVNVINQKYVYINSIQIMANGAPLSYDSEGVLTLDIKTGDKASLSLLGKTDKGEIAIDNSNVQWHLMYEKGLIDFNEGNITALYTGQSAIRVKYITAQLADGTEIGPEEYVVINIIENDKSDLKLAIDAAIANLNSANNASDSLKESYRQAISAAQQVYNDSNATESEISQATAALKLATKLFDEERSKGGNTISPNKSYFTLRATPCENGRLELSSTLARKGTSVTITAIPDKGFRVYDLVINGVSYGNKSIVTIPSINENLIVSAVFREIWDCPFIDINENDWFYNEVEDAYKANLFKGTSEKTFGPYNPMTRAMLVTVLGRMSGISPDYNESSIFEDVAQGSWYTGFVEWAKDNGIINGATATSFAPNSNISREQVAVILYRYAAFIGLDTSITKDNNLSTYKDLSDVSDYAISAMQWAVEKGIISGRSQSELKPKENASRAEIAVILMRFMKLK